jgi:hypothetical protein
MQREKIGFAGIILYRMISPAGDGFKAIHILKVQGACLNPSASGDITRTTLKLIKNNREELDDRTARNYLGSESEDQKTIKFKKRTLIY